MNQTISSANNVSAAYIEQSSVFLHRNISLRNRHSKVSYTYGIVLASAFFIMLSGMFIGGAVAKESVPELAYKYYTSIRIQENDSLWSIAETYIHDSYYTGIHEYIKELKSINGLQTDMLIEGHYLVVPYYSDIRK